MGLISGGTYFLCDVCTTNGSDFTSNVILGTPHPEYGALVFTSSANTAAPITQVRAVTLGGFNGLNN
jgi:hypothetical protein